MSPGPYLIVYTEREGGLLHCFWAGPEGEAREAFGQIVSDRATERPDPKTGDASDVPVAYVGLFRCTNDWDFVLGAPREAVKDAQG